MRSNVKERPKRSETSLLCANVLLCVLAEVSVFFDVLIMVGMTHVCRISSLGVSILGMTTQGPTRGT